MTRLVLRSESEAKIGSFQRTIEDLQGCIDEVAETELEIAILQSRIREINSQGNALMARHEHLTIPIRKESLFESSMEQLEKNHEILREADAILAESSGRLLAEKKSCEAEVEMLEKRLQRMTAAA